jgi:hypothetical protein
MGVLQGLASPKRSRRLVTPERCESRGQIPLPTVGANDTPRFNVEECAIGHLIGHLMLGLRVGWLVALFERSHTAEFHYQAAVEQSSKVAV